MLVDAGAVPMLVPLLGSADQRKWQAAARILSNIAASDSENGDLPVTKLTNDDL